jgi:hypothetical protein
MSTKGADRPQPVSLFLSRYEDCLTASIESEELRFAYLASPIMHIDFLLCGFHQSPMKGHIFFRPLALGILE